MDLQALTQMSAAGLLVILVVYVLKYMVKQQDAKNTYMSAQIESKDKLLEAQRLYIDDLHREARVDAVNTVGVLDNVMKVVRETSANQTNLSGDIHNHFSSIGGALTKLMESLDQRFTHLQEMLGTPKKD